MYELFTKFFKKKIKYHEVSKFLKPNDLFFDVGAHLGDKSKELIKNNIKVVMIEPQPNCLKELKKVTNYTPKTTLKIGIENFMKWYKGYHK